MVESLKKLDKRFLIIAGLIIALPILIIVFLLIVQSCKTRLTQSEYEARMANAAIKYLKDNKREPIDSSSYVVVNLSNLIDEDYISSTKKALDDDSCDGKVIVRRSFSSEEEDVSFNAIARLECFDYKTNTLMDNLKKSIVESGPGLYKDEDGFVFKGDSVKNYVKFGNYTYIAMSIDFDGIVKLLKIDDESLEQTWDTKYNIDVDQAAGKNIYADSNMKKALNKYYSKKISSKLKPKLVPYSICIGKRDYKDISISVEKDCSERMDNQPVSIINVSDFARASLDPDCVNLRSKSCRNYNYLKSLSLSGWTLNTVANDSYSVFYLRYGLIDYEEASASENYNIVIYLDGNERVTSGNGSSSDPYVVE